MSKMDADGTIHTDPEYGPTQEELKATDWGRLPQPGERHNASGIPVSDLSLAALLAQAQMGMAAVDCQVKDCENCNAHRLVWWDCCNALDRSTRIALQSWLKSEGYGLPDAPWEDIAEDGTPLRPHVRPDRA